MKQYNWTIKQLFYPYKVLGKLKAVDSTIALELARKQTKNHNVIVETFDFNYVAPNVQPAELTTKLK